MKKSIYKRCFFSFKSRLKLKLKRSNKNHLLTNKSKFSKNYLKKIFFLKNNKFLKKNF